MVIQMQIPAGSIVVVGTLTVYTWIKIMGHLAWVFLCTNGKYP